MGRPRNREPSLTTQILWLLMDSPKPLFLGEIVGLLGGDYTSTYIMPRLLQLEKRGVVKKREMEREGMGKKIANAYYYNPPNDLFMMQPPSFQESTELTSLEQEQLKQKTEQKLGLLQKLRPNVKICTR